VAGKGREGKEMEGIGECTYVFKFLDFAPYGQRGPLPYVQFIDCFHLIRSVVLCTWQFDWYSLLYQCIVVSILPTTM